MAALLIGAGVLVSHGATGNDPLPALDQPAALGASGAGSSASTASSAATTAATNAPSPAPPTPQTTAPAHDAVEQNFSGTHDLILETKSGGTGALVNTLKSLGVEVTQQYDTVFAGAAVTVTQEQLAAIQAAGTTTSISTDKEATLFSTTTQDAPVWNLDRIDQQNYTPYLGARSYTYPDSAGAGVTVFIIDTGFTRQNNELDGRLGVGADFAGGDHGTPADPSDDTSTRDCNEHGTHVAGTVASTTYGAAKLATIVPVRVFSCSGGTMGSTIVAGINWAIANKPLNSPSVINMSLGTTGGDSRIDQATQAAIDAGITVVVAAGNGGADGYGDDACFGSTNSAGAFEDGTSPARVTGAITVGATGYKFSNYSEPVGYHQDLESYFSNYGSCVDLYAPGGSITSLAYDNPGTLTISGTSMASPLVAGVAALYLGANPKASPTDVQAALVANAAANKVQRAEAFWPVNYGSALPGYPTSRATHTPNLLVNSAFLNFVSAPQTLAAGAATLSSVSLTWEVPLTLNGETITDYVVQYEAAGDVAWSTLDHVASATTGATVQGLTAGTSYQFRVAARTSGGDGAYTGAISLATLSGLPAAPVSFAAGTATLTSVPLTWAAPTVLNGGTITDYTVQYRVTGATQWSTFVHTASATPGATVTALTAKTSYQFQVSAHTDQGDGAATTTVSKSTLSGVTTTPLTLAAGAATLVAVPLTWTAPATLNGGIITTYAVQFRVAGASSWSTFVHTPKATTGLTVTGLSAGRSYQFQVAAHTDQGDSAYAASVSKSTLTGLTTAPLSLAAGTATTTSVALSWTAPLTLNGGIISDYKVQYRRTGTTSWSTFAHTAKATTGTTVTGLTRNLSYQFQVAAHTLQGDSVYTAAVSKSTRAS